MKLEFALVVVHGIVALLLIFVVLMQQGKQPGVSGSVIAGGGETFYGKNKGRTFDGFLSKVTILLASMFIITSIALSLFFNKQGSDLGPSVQRPLNLEEILPQQDDDFLDNSVPYSDSETLSSKNSDIVSSESSSEDTGQ